MTRTNRIRDYYISGTEEVGQFGDKMREVGPRWFGHVQRRSAECNGRRRAKEEVHQCGEGGHV